MNEKQEYILRRRKSNSPEDLTAQMVFELLNLQKTNNAQFFEEFKRGILRHLERQKNEQNSGLQRKEITEVLKKINKSIEHKGTDIRPIIVSLGLIYRQYPKIKDSLDKIAEKLEKNKPIEPKQISFDEVIKSQNSGVKSIIESISGLKNSIKVGNYPDKLNFNGPVEIARPIWWKEFKFSREPLKDFFEKIKSHTFLVKVVNQEKNERCFDTDNLAKKIGKEIDDAINKIPRNGGIRVDTSNLATSDKQDSIIAALSPAYDVLIAAKSTDTNVVYIGKAVPGSLTSASVWQIKVIDKTSGVSISFLNDVATFTQKWDDREV